jgi:adenylate cyclase class 2
MPLNVEIKARCADPARIRQYLHDNQAQFMGIDHQVDTYFRVADGRLKLRQGNIENALIHYQRADQEGPKASQVNLSPVSHGAALRKVLEMALGILAVVDKQREIYFIRNVKFHIDEVEGLGSFVEIEAIDQDGSIGQDALEQDCRFYIHTFGIRDEDLLSNSYSDMLGEPLS